MRLSVCSIADLRAASPASKGSAPIFGRVAVSQSSSSSASANVCSPVSGALPEPFGAAIENLNDDGGRGRSLLASCFQVFACSRCLPMNPFHFSQVENSARGLVRRGS